MMDMPLPEPLDYCYEWDGPYGSRKFSAALHNGRPPDRSVAIYSADQLRARDAQWRAIVAAEVAKERERLLSAAVARADHEAKAAAHHAGTWYEAHAHHLAAHKAMCDLMDAVWPDVAAIRSAAPPQA